MSAPDLLPSLECHESVPTMQEEHDYDDIFGGGGGGGGVGGDVDDNSSSPCSGSIRSAEDPNLLRDERVLLNLMAQPDKGADVVDLQLVFARQPELKPHMRDIVTGWMLDVTEEEQCHREVFCLAVHYLDRVLQHLPVSKGQFQLLGCVCIFLASKFKESKPIQADKLVVFTDFSISLQEIMVIDALIGKILSCCA